MAQKSMFWTTGGAGDGAAEYTQAEVIRWMRQMMIGDNTDEGVHKNYENELAVTDHGDGTVDIASGAAVAYGFPYWNTATVNLNIPTPVAATRIDRVVLQAGWVAQTVRIARVAGLEGGAAPALTQNDGVTWEISLAQVSKTVGGVITITDEREFLHANIEVEGAMLDPDIVDDSTIEINANVVRVKAGGITTAQIANRTRKFFVPAVVGYNVTDGTPIAISMLYTSVLPGIVLADNKSCLGIGQFTVPQDFASGLTVKALVVATASGNVYGAEDYDYGANGEIYTTHAGTGAFAAEAVTLNFFHVVASLALAAAAVGDFVRIAYVRDATNILDTIGNIVMVLGWEISYTADS